MFAGLFVGGSLLLIVGAVWFVGRAEKKAEEAADRVVEAFAAEVAGEDDWLLLGEALGVVRDLPVSASAPLVGSVAPIFDELAVARLRRDLDAWGNSDGAA